MADDTAREDDHEPATDEQVADPIPDEVAAAVVARFPGSVFVDSHGQPVVYVVRHRFLAINIFTGIDTIQDHVAMLKVRHRHDRAG